MEKLRQLILTLTCMLIIKCNGALVCFPILNLVMFSWELSFLLFIIRACACAQDNIWKKQFPRVASHGVKQEYKTYKLTTSIHIAIPHTTKAGFHLVALTLKILKYLFWVITIWHSICFHCCFHKIKLIVTSYTEHYFIPCGWLCGNNVIGMTMH